MKSNRKNTSLIRTICEPIQWHWFWRNSTASLLVAIPTSALLTTIIEWTDPPHALAIILSPGSTIPWFADTFRNATGDFLKPPVPSLAFFANILYWTLVFFGVSRCRCGMRKSRISLPNEPH